MGLKLPKLQLSLATIVTLTVAVSIGAIAYLSLQTVYDQKLRDSEAIVFLQLERQANQLSAFVARTAASVDAENPEIVLRADGQTLVPVRGELKSKLQLADLGLDDLSGLSERAVVSLAGRSYVARVRRAPGEAPTLSLWRIQLAKAGGWPGRGRQTLAYVMNRQGQTAFVSESGATGEALLKRELVQKFIATPTRQGQMKFKSPEGRTVTGFFQEIDGTNLVLFSESTQNPAWIATVGAIRTVVFVGALIVLLSAAILQWSLHVHGRALRRFTADVGRALDRPEASGVQSPGTPELVPLWAAVNALISMRQDAPKAAPVPVPVAVAEAPKAAS